MRLFLSTFLLIFSSYFIQAQINTNRKKAMAHRIEKAPKIDGKLDDESWKNVTILKDFIEFTPNNKAPENTDYKTEIKLAYNDDAIFIGAMLYDPNPNKIPMEFSNRDNFSIADHLSILINPNDDGQNPFQFIVQSTGNQLDAKISNGDEDYNWSAVWDSDVKITDKGWVVEVKIPYRALRFANQEIQSWGFNFMRNIQNINARYTWNYIDNTQGRWTQYDGLIEDLKNISPPTRLNLYPYASAIVTSGDAPNFSWNAGMDIKYGLSENFTLDATLIPDFSQAGFDDVVLNLGPFEQEFTEQRQFFTEGTELFTKGNLFYSRRIGGSPIDQFDVSSELADDEEITDYPTKVDMLNAIKISGRTKKGLGIGVFNAITKNTKATIENTSTGETREVTINPFSNYNILVLDQQFNQNSFLSLINTNVTRDGRFRDANVTGALWHLEDKKSVFNIDGSFKMSNINDDIDNETTGYAFDTSIGKHSGNFNGEIGYNFENKDYDPNDMGILFSNNEQTIYSWIGYRYLKPKGAFNGYSISAYNNINLQHHSGIYTHTSNGGSFWGETTKRFGFGLNLNRTTIRKDYFEPRQGTTSGIYFNQPRRLNINHWGSSDYRKKLAFDYNWSFDFYSNEKESYGFGITPRYRFSNKFSIIYGFSFYESLNDQGYIDETDDDIIFGQRDLTTYNNTITSKYSFNVNSSLSLTFRHNWTTVLYDEQYLSLQENGNLTNYDYEGTDNLNFNSWNLDLNYVWQFAPGSQLIALYRNSINPDADFASANLGFFENVDQLFQQNMQHTFSLRLVYFVDYNQLKKII